MSEVNKQELRRLAEAATQGEWEYIPGDEAGSWASQFPAVTSPDGEIIGTEGFYSDKERDEANAAYVAKANPAAILSLLDELEKVDADRKACWAEFKALRRSADDNERCLREELEQYRKDAERYRWLRDKHNEVNGDTWVSVWSGEWKSLDSHLLPDFDGDLDLDKAVDAAMANEGGAND